MAGVRDARACAALSRGVLRHGDRMHEQREVSRRQTAGVRVLLDGGARGWATVARGARMEMRAGRGEARLSPWIAGAVSAEVVATGCGTEPPCVATRCLVCA